MRYVIMFVALVAPMMDAMIVEYYRSCIQDNGYNTWVSDADRLLSLDKLCESVADPYEIHDGRITLGDFLKVSIDSALFNGYWSPAWEQKAACNFIRDRISSLKKAGISIPDKVRSALNDILSFEEEEDL